MLTDLRLALRRLWLKPTHTALLVLVLGLGTGSATAIFTVVDQTILRPPPFAHADRLVEVLDLYRSAGARSSTLTPAKIAGWQQQGALFEAFEGFASKQVDVMTTGGEPERVNGLGVTSGLLRMLGVRPLIGRDFAEGDGRSGAERVVLISESLWRRRFGGQRQVLGTSITLNDVPYAVIGVLPRQFRLTGSGEHLWLPVDVRSVASDAPQRFIGIARLAPGLAPGSEQQAADTIAARLQSGLPLAGEPFWDISLSRKTVAHVPDSTRTALFVLLGAVGFVLLITCANTASLILSAMGVRERETAIRVSIGASRARLFREVLIESVVLAACGGGLGILLATWGVDAIVAAAPPNFASASTSPIEVDGRILAICAAATLLTGMVIGLVPAVRGSRQNVDAILKTASGSSQGRTARTRLSSSLVAAEVAFSVILLVGAALMARTFANLHALDPGFDGDGVIGVTLSLPTDKYVGEGARVAFLDGVRERIKALPGVLDVAVAADVFDGNGIYFGRVDEVEGRDPAARAGRLQIPSNVVTDEYFRTLRIPVLSGRSFDASDGAGAVILSRDLADRLWPAGDAVGRRFKLDSGYPWETVIGVVGNVEGRGSGDGTKPHRIYRRMAPPAAATATPPRTRGYAARVMLVRASNPLAVVPGIRAAVWSLDAHQPIGRVSTVDDVYADTFARERFVLQLMAGFGLLAVILTATGLFGVLSQVVAHRRREIGVRMALGARPADIMQLVIGRGLIPLSIGIAAGLAGAGGLARFLRALLFAVSPIDPGSFTAVAAAMIVIGLLACWLPTRRAVHVDPVVALRAE